MTDARSPTLKDLIRQWRGRAAGMPRGVYPEAKAAYEVARDALGNCANELEAALPAALADSAAALAEFVGEAEKQLADAANRHMREFAARELEALAEWALDVSKEPGLGALVHAVYRARVRAGDLRDDVRDVASDRSEAAKPGGE